jgi:hypothetical protein
MAPNWAFLLADQLKADPTGIDAAIQKLQALDFGLSLGLDGNAKVTHNELAAENEQIASGLRQICSGIEQMAAGFPQEISLAGSYGTAAFKVNFTSGQATKH